MTRNVIGAMLDFKSTLPNMSWHLDGDVLVTQTWLTPDEAQLLRDGQRLMQPVTRPAGHSYEDYLSDEPDQHGLPDGLTREEYEALPVGHLDSPEKWVRP